MSRQIAIFDLDGTITRKDTFFDFLLFAFGPSKVLLKIVTNSFKFLHVFLQTGSLSKVKESIFGSFFSSASEDFFLKKGKQYSIERLPFIVRPAAHKEIKWHLARGHSLIIATASLRQWIEFWARKEGFSKIISTEAEILNGILTGSFASSNCKGEDKKIRVVSALPGISSSILYVYGDSRHDEPLMSLAQFRFKNKFPLSSSDE